MPRTTKRLSTRVLASIAFFSAAPSTAPAQTYPIDCAILLCLSGGWPSSVPCSRARAEFIRRITPWPVEPPLQIWRCPMSASYRFDNEFGQAAQIFEVLSNELGALPQSFPQHSRMTTFEAQFANANENGPGRAALPEGLAFRLAQEQADIDISGPEFNFVRSIRVFDVRYARQHESGQDGDCNRSATVVLGTYGTQGDFSWVRSSIAALPAAHVGLENWGRNCPSIYHRSVFVDWRDFEGNYGSEQVNY